MAEAIGMIQGLILKPEWKELVQDVLENEQLTVRTQESVLAVANAVVTPLSLLVYAAELPRESIDECRTLWKETLKHLAREEPELQKETDKISNDGGGEIEVETENQDKVDSAEKVAKRKLTFGNGNPVQTEETGLDDALVDNDLEMDQQQEQPAGMRIFPEPVPIFPEQLAEPETVKTNQILAKRAAKKGLVDERSFHERNRSNGQKVITKTAL